jgi:hypothetical protein
MPAGSVQLALNLAGATPNGRIRINGRRWLLRDTMAFFKVGLDTACQRLCLPVRKLPRPAYLGERAPTTQEWSEFEAYALNDAVATHAIGKFIVVRHDELGVPLTVSVAHMAATIFRQRFLPAPAGSHHDGFEV